jgi:integrase
VSGIEGNDIRQAALWSRRKKDAAPRGVFRHRSGVWAVRYACSAGCSKHEEKVGPIKSEAIRIYHQRRARALGEPGWCPAVERQHARERSQVERERERLRVTFRDYATNYLEWVQSVDSNGNRTRRSWETIRSQINVSLPTFGDKRLDEITTGNIERFRDALLTGWPGRDAVSQATANRYRDLLSAMYRRAIRLGHVTTNPVKGVEKFKEPGGRVVYLPPASKDRSAFEEEAMREALPQKYRPDFIISVHTGLRWSEQMNLRWNDVDLLSGFITVPRSKHGDVRRVPINVAARAAFLDLAMQRRHPDDPVEPVFPDRPKQADKFFPKAVARAREVLREAGRDANRLEGYTWHSNRHTFGSLLAMAGVPDRTIQELGGWKTLKMVQRYSHLSAAYLHEAVARLIESGDTSDPGNGGKGALELRQNFDDAASRRLGVS